ncbi:MAG TPA: diguanylate cyclase [Polyangiaceae bacterium]|nr:diguanylate cyclase [Polyangiaceae bacterium]
MRAPDIPPGETERIMELRSYEVLDTASDTTLDTITELAAQILDVPIALISLVDSDRQWFKSRHGLSVTETPRVISFCGHVVAQGQPLVVHDAFADPRFSDNPLVTGEPHVRFYAGVPLQTPTGAALGTLCAIDHVARDLTRAQLEQLSRLATLVMAQLEAGRSRNIARRVVDGVPGMLAYWDKDQRCRFANAAYEAWFGVKPEELIGRTMRELLGPIYPRNLPYIEGALRGETQAFEREIPDPHGGPPRHSQAHYLPHVVNGEVPGFAVMVTDISAQKKVEAALREAQAQALALATHDSLTGLPNRLLAHERLDRALEHAKRFRRRAAVLFIDLDGFKTINDSLGHAAGDAVLKEVAARMLACTRTSDTVARLGGDEFLVLLPEVEDSESAATVARKLLGAMAENPFEVVGQTLNVSFSVGVAVFPDHAADPRELLASADAALYRAKRAGKNQLALSTPE